MSGLPAGNYKVYIAGHYTFSQCYTSCKTISDISCLVGGLTTGATTSCCSTTSGTACFVDWDATVSPLITNVYDDKSLIMTYDITLTSSCLVSTLANTNAISTQNYVVTNTTQTVYFTDFTQSPNCLYTYVYTMTCNGGTCPSAITLSSSSL